jgi:hypothetical protein
VADLVSWRDAAESELRAMGEQLRVPPASDIAAVVRQRLEGRATDRGQSPALRDAIARRRLGWRTVLVAAAVILALLIATPGGRAVISHVFRFLGVEVRQQPGPVRSPPTSAPLPGQHGTSLARARRQAAFPILVPAALGKPDEVLVSGGGRVVSLIYRHTPHGTVRLDEFSGHTDRLVFEKFGHAGKVREVAVHGGQGLWIKGPQELIYLTPKGRPAFASARLTTGNTLIWGTYRVAVRLEGDLSEATAIAIADSAR